MSSRYWVLPDNQSSREPVNAFGNPTQITFVLGISMLSEQESYRRLFLLQTYESQSFSINS